MKSLSHTVGAFVLAFSLSSLSGAMASVVLSQNGSINPGAINSFYASEGHTVNVISSGSAVIPGMLAGVDLFVAYEPSNSFTNSEISVMGSYLAGGGHILFQGEAGGYSSAIVAYINGALSGLNANMSINGGSYDGGYHTASKANGQILSHALTDGVDTFQYAYTSGVSGVSGGEALFLTSNRSTVWGASESVGGGTITLLTDSNTVEFNGSYDNEVFYRNLLKSEPAAVPEATSLLAWTVVLGGIGLILYQRQMFGGPPAV